MSVMFVNNEIGSVEPVEELGKRIRRKNPQAYFHVDAIQAFGKYRIHPGRMNIDLLSASGHKIHGPKGVGLLYAGEKVKFRPLILGGRPAERHALRHRQRAGSRRNGGGRPEEYTAGLRKPGAHVPDKAETCGGTRPDGACGASRNGAGGRSAAYPECFFYRIRSEVLLHALEDRGIYVSAGSACSSHRRAGSATLAAIGCGRAEMESAVRFSFCEYTTEEEIDETLKVLNEIVPMLRRFTRR